MITKNLSNVEIGQRIKKRRNDLNLTLHEVADSVGVAISTVQRYENGTISRYKLPVIESIAKTLEVNPSWLIKNDAPIDLSKTIADKYDELNDDYKKLIEIQINQLLELQNKH